MTEWLLSDGTPDFHRLFERARPQLLAVARRVVRNDADAEDVLQRAFENAIKAGSRFEARAQATSWMYRIVYNTALMHLRTRRRKGAESLDALPAAVGEAVVARDREGTGIDMDDLVDRSRLGAMLGRALSSLPELDQKIVLLRLYEERSTQEVADAVGISAAATKTRLHRARTALQQLLGDTEFTWASA